MQKKCVYPAEIALGVAVMGKKKVVRSVESLEEKGTKGYRQLREFLSDAQSEGAKCKHSIGKRVKDSVKKAMGDSGFVTADEVAKVHQEILEVKSMLNSASPAKS